MNEEEKKQLAAEIYEEAAKLSELIKRARNEAELRVDVSVDSNFLGTFRGKPVYAAIVAVSIYEQVRP